MEISPKQSIQDSTPVTTYIQADTNNFRELVQRLTGSSEDSSKTTTSNVHQINNEGEGASIKGIGVKKPTFKLHERRQYSKSKLEILKPNSQFKSGSPLSSPSRTGSHTSQSFYSPTNIGLLPSPSNTFSKLSIFEEKEEEKAIKERRFYLHSSPQSRTSSEPELLALFPLTSPKSNQG